MDVTINKIQTDDLLSKTEVFPISLWMDILTRLEHLSEPQSPFTKANIFQCLLVISHGSAAMRATIFKMPPSNAISQKQLELQLD